MRGENVYVNGYPNTTNGLQCPPYNPIWILYLAVPFSTFPLDIAEAFRFSVDLLAVPLLACACVRWAYLKKMRYTWLLATAPWNVAMVYLGQ